MFGTAENISELGACFVYFFSIFSSYALLFQTNAASNLYLYLSKILFQFWSQSFFLFVFRPAWNYTIGYPAICLISTKSLQYWSSFNFLTGHFLHTSFCYRACWRKILGKILNSGHLASFSKTLKIHLGWQFCSYVAHLSAETIHLLNIDDLVIR